MLYNYWLTTWRNVTRNKAYAAINIVGLAMGISACILIFLYIHDELSYDKHFSDADRIYRVVSDASLNGDIHRVAASPGPLAPALVAEYPEVVHATRLLPVGEQALRTDDKAFYIKHVMYADSNAFEVLDFPFVAGNPATAFKHPNSVVLTEEVARKFFGGAAEAMGKVLKHIQTPLQVTGVISVAAPSHIKADVFIPLHVGAGEYLYFLSSWDNLSAYTYLKLHNPEQAATLQHKLPGFYERKVKGQLSGNGPTDLRFHLQHLTEAYMDNAREYPISEVGDKAYVYLFAVVAAFILAIASINYINLATARSAKRAREVGLRKVAGASRTQVVLQFLAESVFLTLIATFLALVIVELILPTFNAVTEKQIDTVFLLTPGLAVALVMLILLIGVGAGSYPAFFLSRYKPAEVLKAHQIPTAGGAILRKALVVVQFTVSLVLIMGTVVVYSQMLFLKNKELGFNKEQVIAVKIPAIGWVKQKENLALIKKELLSLPQVLHTSSTQSLPGQPVNVFPFLIDIDHKVIKKSLNNFRVGYNYLQVMQVKLVEGRDFSESIQTDHQNGYIINQAAAREFGWTGNAVGKSIRGSWADTTNGKVIGVVQDFNYKSLHSKIEPLVIMLDPNFGTLLARINARANVAATLKNMERVWQNHFPEYPMDYHFLDESFQQQYRAEAKMLTIFTYFSILTIIVACLGLFGLSSYTAEQRTKEIGIRKVLGSTVTGIVLLLSRHFAMLVLLAVALAVPITWYSMHVWLQDFAYRTEISWWLFATAGLVSMLIALLTVSFHAIKAATADPVKALRAD
ncbi:ABC transporter permease [Pontibacter mangrovi]|uniref:FtsX-like permease family protein n=1 Tax=Pontibacter mangrovi TaxID=2589816 RepID=A0A501W6X8_9BACT|nr:ABC transporter permease [Pontibacter mangrovi]TPE44385.1 FtsX-like permease family protein [Pontibacter mangrovi]